MKKFFTLLVLVVALLASTCQAQLLKGVGWNTVSTDECFKVEATEMATGKVHYSQCLSDKYKYNDDANAVVTSNGDYIAIFESADTQYSLEHFTFNGGDLKEVTLCDLPFKMSYGGLFYSNGTLYVVAAPYDFGSAYLYSVSLDTCAITKVSSGIVDYSKSNTMSLNGTSQVYFSIETKTFEVLNMGTLSVEKLAPPPQWKGIRLFSSIGLVPTAVGAPHMLAGVALGSPPTFGIWGIDLDAAGGHSDATLLLNTTENFLVKSGPFISGGTVTYAIWGDHPKMPALHFHCTLVVIEPFQGNMYTLESIPGDYQYPDAPRNGFRFAQNL